MVAKAAGGFLGGLTNNPGAVIILLGLGALLIFRKDITNFLDKGIGNINLPDINLPDIKFPDFDFKFPDFDFKFPDIKFPDFSFDFGDPLKDIQTSIDNIVNQFTNLDQPGREMGTTPMPDVIPDTTGGLAERRRAQEEAAERAAAERALEEAGPIGGSEIVSARNELEFRARQIQNIIQPVRQVQTAIPDQTFQGGGISFIGGSVSEIPIERLSLGSIIDRLGVTASQAASLRAEAIGFTQEEQAFLNQGQELSPLGDLGPQTSGGFQGLTPEQIALRLTGGIISNF